jgi:catechol 2,3-dioxygenase-like lactoylglutathione lyase family enzyme
MAVRHLDHVEIIVDDLDAAVAFFVALGMTADPVNEVVDYREPTGSATSGARRASSWNWPKSSPVAIECATREDRAPMRCSSLHNVYYGGSPEVLPVQVRPAATTATLAGDRDGVAHGVPDPRPARRVRRSATP